MTLIPYQPPAPRLRGCALPMAVVIVFVGLLALVIVPAAPAATAPGGMNWLAPATASPVALQLVASAAPSDSKTAADPDIPAGSPLGTRGVVMTQGYGVGSHAPAAIWGAVDLALDGDGDGQADAQATNGAPIYATLRGTVTVTPNSVPAGNHVWVANAHYKTGYSHLNTFAPGLATGHTVERGTLLGTVGATGQASGPHVDYQVWKDGVNVDPLLYGALPNDAQTSFIMANTATRMDAAAVRLVRRDVGSGHLAAIMVRLGPATRVAVVAADGATQSTDTTGDTTWADGGSHLRTVREMVVAPYAQQAGWTLRGGINFGFFGARTSDEGTVVVDGEMRHVNPGRAAVCLTRDGDARIGVFTVDALHACAQAFGAGPVVMVGKQLVGVQLPFNPLREDFVQSDWRKAVYAGTSPKTTIGIGRDDLGTVLVLSVAWDLTGVEIGRVLLALGVTDAIGGDDDTSSQMRWDGQVIRDGQAVPDMVAVYTREKEN